MENNKTTSTLEDECEKDNDCLFVIGDGFFRVWHVILIAAAIVILICKLLCVYVFILSHTTCSGGGGTML